MLSRAHKDWLQEVARGLPAFLDSLALPDQPGRYLPCRRGLTPAGREVALGFSCLALKLAYTLGRWEALAEDRRRAWLEFIRGFQAEDDQPQELMRGAFLDPALIGRLRPEPWWRRLGRRGPDARTRAVIAETKQAIATLAEVGASPRRPYLAFPRTREAVRAWLEGLDWRRPWTAGALAAQLAVFLRTQAPAVLAPPQVEALVREEADFLARLADPDTGAYWRGSRPERGELINGAMKVLTALDWLEEPVHHPRALTALCLAELPRPEGCHLVDLVYVLHRCAQEQRHHRQQVHDYALQVLDMIRRHHNPDRGFSYYIGRSQTNYYGVDIARGLEESDLHGSLLLAWALAMLMELLEEDELGWRVIRP